MKLAVKLAVKVAAVAERGDEEEEPKMPRMKIPRKVPWGSRRLTQPPGSPLKALATSPRHAKIESGVRARIAGLSIAMGHSKV